MIEFSAHAGRGAKAPDGAEPGNRSAHARGHGAVAKPPQGRARLAYEPRPPTDDDHRGQRLVAALSIGVERPQARDKRLGIATAVRVVLPDERPAARLCLHYGPP